MTRSLNRLQAIILGLVVLTGVALGGWGAFQIGSRQRLFGDTYELRAGFSQAHGLEKGTPVRVRGIDAGQVVGIELPPDDNPNGKVYVRLRLDTKFRGLIPTDSKARVLNEGMLGGRLINIEPGKHPNARLEHGDELATLESQDIADLMSEAGQTLREIRESNGTIAKLLKSDEAHKEVVQLVKDTQAMVKRGEETLKKSEAALEQGKDALTVIKQDADAVKRLPIIRGYVEDSQSLLYRPHMGADRRIFNAHDLFEPGRAVLTSTGRHHLGMLSEWLQSNKVKNSEIVVVSYSDPSANDIPAATAQTLTLRRSEAVMSYLRDSIKAHKLGWMSSRKMTPLGMGRNLPPVPETVQLPPDRTEIFVFTP